MFSIRNLSKFHLNLSHVACFLYTFSIDQKKFQFLLNVSNQATIINFSHGTKIVHFFTNGEWKLGTNSRL